MEKKQALLTMMDLDKDPKELATAEEAYAFFQRVSAIEKLVAGIREQTRLRMFELAEKEGEADDKGSFTVKFADGTGYQKQARVSMKLLTDKTIQYLKDNNIDGILEIVQKPKTDADHLEELVKLLEEVRPDLLEKEEVINEDRLNEAVLNEVIPMDDFKELVERKTTFALIDLAKKKK